VSGTKLISGGSDGRGTWYSEEEVPTAGDGDGQEVTGSNGSRSPKPSAKPR